MNRYGRRLVIARDFEKTVSAVHRALRDEGLEVIGRLDVRDHLRRCLRRDLGQGQYVRLEAWCPETAFEMLRQQPDVGAILAITLAIYESKPNETIVVAEGLRARQPAIAGMQDQEIVRLGRVFHHLERSVDEHADQSAA
jgi:uncharacterized protein (DUF302 family)